MRQLVLDVRADAAPTLDNFVTGGNAELLAALARCADGEAGVPGGSAHLYLWGAPASGRTHLLRATVARAQRRGRPAMLIAAAVGDELPQTTGALIAVDDVDTLNDAAQIALFNAFNRARSGARTLLLAGAAPPLELAVREDLRTRIGQTLVYQIQPLDDDTRARILTTLAARRGLQLGAEVVDFLLRHGSRELPRLLAVLDALDAASLEHKRAPTVPLLRTLMRDGLAI